MTKSHTPLHIATTAARENQASPEHRRFKTLLTKIDAARQRLAEWHEQLPLFTQAYAERVQPEVDQLMAAQRAWALELESIALRPWSKADRETLAQMICDLCSDVLDAGAEPDKELKALYNRFAEVEFDAEGEQHLQGMKAMLEQMGGFDLGEEPVDSVEELMRRAQAEMVRRGEAGAAPAFDGAQAHHPGRARKAAAKTAAQRRAEEDARRISQTVREVYRKLAAALHPDRTAADATPKERDERLALMQRANAAYEAGDLLALLSLQLQIEQVDVAHAAGVAAAQVKHFNRVLAEQLREIEAEIDERQMALGATYGIVLHQRLAPGQLGALLKDEVRQVVAAQAVLAREQRALRGEPAAARRWLKNKRSEMKLEDQLEELMSDQFAELAEMARRRR